MYSNWYYPLHIVIWIEKTVGLHLQRWKHNSRVNWGNSVLAKYVKFANLIAFYIHLMEYWEVSAKDPINLFKRWNPLLI